MSQNIVISAERLGKRYRRGVVSDRHNSVRDTLAAGVRALVRGRRPESGVRDTFWALQDEILCCNFSNYLDNADLPGISGDGNVELLTPPLKIVSGRYTVTIAACERGFQESVAGQIAVGFHLRHEILEASVFGVFHEPARWRVVDLIPERTESAHEFR